MKMRKICFISCAHPYDDVRLTHRMAKSLVDIGHDVTWIGPKPSNFSSLYNIKFHFYSVTPGKLGRFANAKKIELILKSIDASKIDFFYAAEPDSAKLGIKLGKIYNAKSIFDIHEIFHDEMLVRWVGNKLKSIVGFFVQKQIRRICRKSDLIIGVGKTRLEPYISKGCNSLIIRHCLPLSFAINDKKRNKDEFLIMHGKATTNQGTAQVLSALEILKKTLNKSLKVFLVDSNDKDTVIYKKMINDLDLNDSILFSPVIPFSEMIDATSKCKIGIIAYDRLFGVKCMPNRVFEYMALGLPIIAPSYSIEINEIIEKYNCGVLCDTESGSSIADAIIELVNDKEKYRMMSENGVKAFKEELNWEKEIIPFFEWINLN